ncbi:anthranilate phosphoribosyltransferase [Puniceicoccus vermicola]|uniref:Anthranilate phosphoribosyltransferase n=1 Tax=Puniceicoccus vermicola TaxID=388746 RepID=A0A7X1E2X3_9BACT|nr:anthranilate phosphoribosyltransferase [Puniceicoccus vermicola]MBC2600920.1 anthranilate phosphoribosyltransferase [Puniceicoccus vermicola]
MSSNPNPTEELIALTQKLAAQESLTVSEARTGAAALADPTPSVETKESFLLTLAQKGETPDEVFAFAQEFRERAVDPEMSDIAPDAIDIVGTGGDRSGTFNFSSATGLLLASMGVPVMKHGNRSITSKSGSADLLAALGIPMESKPDHLRKSLEEFNFCFFFAPSFHPSFKEIMPVRKKLAESGQKTIFNLLGPLINPGKPTHQLMGVFSQDWVSPIAGALDSLDLKAALVVHCQVSETLGVDELTVAGPNFIEGAGRLKGETFPSRPSEFGLIGGPITDILGGSAKQNLIILRSLANGVITGPMADTLCLNAGAALYTCGRSKTIKAGIEAAQAALQDKTLEKWLARFEDFNRKDS